MNNICQSEPLSWLTLERYHLRELPIEESLQVREHLDDCSCCRICLEQIKKDDLVPLPLLAFEASPQKPWPWWLRFGSVTTGVGFATATAVLLFFFAGNPTSKNLAFPPPRITLKGGDMAISLVRERKGSILHNPTTFLPKDRFKVLVTCPPPMILPWKLVVIQNKQISFPLSPSGPILCSNRVALPSAFRIVGSSPAVICLVLGKTTLPRSLPPSKLPKQWPTKTVCVKLRPID